EGAGSRAPGKDGDPGRARRWGVGDRHRRPAAAPREGESCVADHVAAGVIAEQGEDTARAGGSSPGGEAVSLRGANRHQLITALPGAGRHELQRTVARMGVSRIEVTGSLAGKIPTGRTKLKAAVRHQVCGWAEAQVVEPEGA